MGRDIRERSSMAADGNAPADCCIPAGVWWKGAIGGMVLPDSDGLLFPGPASVFICPLLAVRM